MFNTIPLRDIILRMIVNNPVKYRNTNVKSPYFLLGITFFFIRYKSVILNELYYKGLIDLHGDLTLFIKAKTARETGYLRVEASVTQKGMSYYHTNILGKAPQAEQISCQEYKRKKLSVIR